MNRTDRLMAIVLQLQKRDKVTAEELASLFEISVRTVYRDIQAISEAGVPVAAVPGQGYSLMEGYFLPPVAFEPAEAAVLLLGSQAVRTQLGSVYRTAAANAEEKLEAVLPEAVRTRVEALRSRIRFMERPFQADEVFELLSDAVVAEECVKFTYKTKAEIMAGTGAPGKLREVEPYGVVQLRGVWHLVGRCRLRQELRQFRMDRMSSVVRTGESFKRPDHFHIEGYRPAENRTLQIQVRLGPEAVERFREERGYFVTGETAEPDGGLLVTMLAWQENDVLPWILGWGDQAEVLEPAALRERVEGIAAAMIKKYACARELLT